MRGVTCLSLALLLASWTLSPPPPVEGATVCDKCESSTLKAAGKLVQTVFKCHGKHARRPDQNGPGEPRDPGIPNAQAKFVKACDKAVARAAKKGGTVTFAAAPGDMAADASVAVAVFVTDEVYPDWNQQLTADNALRAAILKAVAKMCGKQLAAFAKNAKRPDAAKLAAARAKARGRFVSAVEKAIAKALRGSVAWKGASAANLADGLEALVNGIAGDVPGSLSCTAPISGNKPRIRWTWTSVPNLNSCSSKPRHFGFRVEGGSGKVEIAVAINPTGQNVVATCTAEVKAGRRYYLVAPFQLGNWQGPGFSVMYGVHVTSGSAPDAFKSNLPSCMVLVPLPNPDPTQPPWMLPEERLPQSFGFEDAPYVVEDPSDRLAALEGSWRGVLVDPDGTPHEVSFALDDWGIVSDHRLDGAMTGLEATFEGNSSSRLDYLDSTGAEGWVFRDQGAEHIAIFVPDGPTALLQKGSGSLPSTGPGDLAGTLWGQGRRLDTDGKLRSLKQRIRVKRDSTCFGMWSTEETYRVDFSTHDLPHGVHSGSVTEGEGQGAAVTLLLSHDRTHAALRTENSADGTWTMNLLGPDACLAPFEGSWLGTLQDSNEQMHEASFTIDARGNVTDYEVDGSDTGVTAQLNLAEDDYTTKCPDLVACTDSEGTRSWIHLAETGEHLAFWAEDYHLAVLQKGATSLPTFGATDLDGDWTGATYDFDAEWSLAEEGDVSLSYSGSTFTGRFWWPFVGTLGEHDAAYGRYPGQWQDADYPDFAGGTRFLLSPDKEILLSFWTNPVEGWVYATDCRFAVSTRDD